MSGSNSQSGSAEQPSYMFLWKQMSSYAAACIGALAADGARIWSTHQVSTEVAPYEDDAWGIPSLAWTQSPDVGAIHAAIESHRPHALIVSSWNIADYRRIARRQRGGPLRVLCMDNQWLGTLRQRAACVSSRWYLRSAFDVAWVPGDGAFEFAQRLGFAPSTIWWGLYSADVEAFEPPAGQPPSESFVFVGRLVEAKGIDVLAEAYQRYRAAVASPWPLLVAGTGDKQSRLQHVQGVEMLGFIQPADLPGILRQAGCLVLPSRFEPWGVVVHEATAAGLPVIASTACGATRRLVLDGHNGRLVAAGDADDLCRALIEQSSRTPADRSIQSERSSRLAQQLTPEQWVQTLQRGTKKFHALRGESR